MIIGFLGKTLAVGYENGSISLHSIENGELLTTTQSHSAKIQCLYWTQMAPSGNKVKLK